MSLRVLMTADAVGGVWTYALDLARGLAAHGVETILAVMGPPPSADQRRAAATIPSLALIDTGLPLDWLVETPEEIACAGAAIVRLAAAQQVDLVHLNTPALAAISPSPARGEGFSRISTVAVTHSCVATWWDAVRTGPRPADFAWRTALHKAGLEAADAIIGPSIAHADATQRLYGLRPRVVHNGRAPLAAPPRPMSEEAFTAGRLWDQGKNLATLDRAAARLTVPLYAAGPRAGANGETITFERIRPLGHLSNADLGERLAARPVFVSAALYEPFGLAVLEAAAAGCALVLSDIPTFRELWEGCATFVAPRDDRAFAAAITGMIADPDHRIAQGEAARTRARRFTPQATAAATLAIYRTLRPVREAAAA